MNDAPNPEINPLAFPEVLLAQAMALMSCHLESHEARCKARLAREVIDRLFSLSGHPMLSEEFRTLLWGLHTRWQLEAENNAAAARWGAHDLRHGAPTRIQ